MHTEKGFPYWHTGLYFFLLHLCNITLFSGGKTIPNSKSTMTLGVFPHTQV